MTLSLFELAAAVSQPQCPHRLAESEVPTAAGGRGHAAGGLTSTLALVGVNRLAPGLGIGRTVGEVVRQVDFSATVLRFMLAYLLFAGAMHVDLEALMHRAWTAAVLATVGVIVSAGRDRRRLLARSAMDRCPPDLRLALVFAF